MQRHPRDDLVVGRPRSPPPTGRRRGRSRSGRSGALRPTSPAREPRPTAARDRRPAADVEVAVVVHDRVRQRLGRQVVVAHGVAQGRAVHGVVDDSLGHARRAGDLHDGLLARDAGRLRRPTTRGQRGRVGDRLRAGCPRDDEGDLAAHARLGPRDELGEGPRRTSSWVLVSSRQTAPATVVAEGLGHRRERGSGAVRRLEEHQGARLVGQGGQPTQPFPCLARQEPLEAEPVDRQPRDRQRGEHGGGPGTLVTVTPCSMAAATSR